MKTVVWLVVLSLYKGNVYKNYGFTVFSDGGLLEDNFDNIAFDNMMWDAGLGLTVKTPLGPARLDYAFQINNKGRRKIQLGVQSLFW